MESSVALSKSYVDTLTHTLKGTLKNKEDIVYRDRWRDRVVEVKDTVYVEKPIQVEKPVRYVPKLYKVSLVLWVFVILYIVLKIYLKKKA